MDRPNIVFLFSDQQRWDTVSSYGEPLGASFGLTPVLDRLAREGTLFERAFTCQPVCGPARACLQTGRYPTEVGCPVNDRMLPASAKGIARFLHDAGYETAYVGKWHLASHHSGEGRPDSVDHRTAAVPPELRGGYEDYWMAADVLEFTSHGYGGFVFDRNGQKREFTGYRADAVTDYALDYLRQPKEKPFFLFVSYLEPHFQNDTGRHEGPAGSKDRFRDFAVPADLEGLPGDWQEEMPDYLGCCESLDRNVGRIVETLKERGFYEHDPLLYIGSRLPFSHPQCGIQAFLS